MNPSPPALHLAWLWYRLSRRLLARYRRVSFYLFKVRYRLARKLVSRYRNLSLHFIALRYRLMRRIRFRSLRLLVFFMWRLWLGKVYGFDKIPMDEPAIVVSNHLSYFDFFILASVLKKQTVFIAVKSLDQRSFVGWFMKLDIIIYVDRDRPGYRFFKELMWHLKTQRRLAVIYPEGTRSRTGKMLTPKPGFVKLAIQAGVPVMPVAMKGTYEILPPHKRIPRLKKCDIYVGDRIYISPQNPEFHDIFFRKSGRQRRYKDLEDDELQEIAFRIMEKVRRMAGEDWDESVQRPRLSIPEDVARRHKELLRETLR